MSNPADRQARRNFLKRAALAAVVLPVSAPLLSRVAHAQELKPLDLENPTAKALGYVEDAADVDKAKYPQFKEGSNCANCQFYVDNPAEGVGGCTLFPGYSVTDAGWCVSWQPKA